MGLPGGGVGKNASNNKVFKTSPRRSHMKRFGDKARSEANYKIESYWMKMQSVLSVGVIYPREGGSRVHPSYLEIYCLPTSLARAQSWLGTYFIKPSHFTFRLSKNLAFMGSK
jgi:hypothetical protein